MTTVRDWSEKFDRSDGRSKRAIWEIDRFRLLQRKGILLRL